ncbi:hypothetical protein HFP72_01500 [Nocardiopsis sp. ARC36]
MDTAEEKPGRFGFDRAEFELHLAEAALGHAPAGAGAHAVTSVGFKRVGLRVGVSGPGRGSRSRV